MSIRLQTWFPYHIQVAMNGREWLRRRLETRHVEFLRQGNKFLHTDDYRLAQRFLNHQVVRNWPHLLRSFLPIAFPTMRQTLGEHLSYYWTLWQSEWATDLIMNTSAELTATMGSLLRHAVITGNIGPNAYRTLSTAKVKVFLADKQTIPQAIDSFKEGKLKEVDQANVEGHWA